MSALQRGLVDSNAASRDRPATTTFVVPTARRALSPTPRRSRVRTRAVSLRRRPGAPTSRARPEGTGSSRRSRRTARTTEAYAHGGRAEARIAQEREVEHRLGDTQLPPHERGAAAAAAKHASIRVSVQPR